MRIIPELTKMWDEIPEPLRTADYVFYCSSDWVDVPDTFNGKRLEVTYLLKSKQIAYAPNNLVYDEDSLRNSNP